MENEEHSSPEQAPVAAPVPATPAAPPFDPRRRIRELLAIPERDRTDAEWDELNELEIQTAPGNRSGNAQPYYAANRPGGFPQKNRNKNKQRKAGGQGGNRPPQQGNKPNKPPRST